MKDLFIKQNIECKLDVSKTLALIVNYNNRGRGLSRLYMYYDVVETWLYFNTFWVSDRRKVTIQIFVTAQAKLGLELGNAL